MPEALVKAASKQLGKPKKRMEHLWDKAKEVVLKQYPKLEPKSSDWYAAVMGVFKKMSGYKPLSMQEIKNKPLEYRLLCIFEEQKQIREMING